MEEEKVNWVEINKFCVACGKKHSIKAVAKRGQFKKIMEIAKYAYICENCSNRGETFVNLEFAKDLLKEGLEIKKDRKNDYVEVHKYCINCGREDVTNIAVIAGQYGAIYDVIRTNFLCMNCNPFGKNFHGNILALLDVMEGDGIPEGVFEITK